MYSEKKINNVSIEIPITTEPTYTTKNLYGFDLIPRPYFNMFLNAKKKSGKTSVIYNIIKNCTNKTCCFWIFCSTVNLDPTWRSIIKFLEERGNLVNKYETIIDGKVDHLSEILDQLADDEEAAADDKRDQYEAHKGCLFNDNRPKLAAKPKIIVSTEETERRRKKPKRMAAEHFFIFDDVSTMLKARSVSSLFKRHRHFKASVIVSSQYLHDVDRQCLLQLDYFLAFRGMSEDKMEVVHQLLDLSIPYQTLWDIYKYCTQEPYSFMYLSVRDEEIRSGFDKLIEYKTDE
jgi:hypothetical protein